VLVEKLCMACEPHAAAYYSFEDFSLAPDASIGDNPALSHSGGTWASNSQTDRARSDRGKSQRSGAGKLPEA
jgi:hypothetical protein